jgi:hypothetical protein
MAESSSQRRSPPWHWPPRPLALAVAGCAAVLAIVINLPAVSVPHPDLREGVRGMHFNLTTEYEHGWPLRYARRSLAQRTPSDGPPPAWHPWEGPGQRSGANLLADLAIWTLAIVAAGVAAQYWRSRRRAIWQLDLRDLLVVTAAAALVFAWLAAARLDEQREARLLVQSQERLGIHQGHDFAASVPAWWPEGLQDRYRGVFNRTCFYHSAGNTDLACQHRHVITLRETDFHPEFTKHVRQMPQLEALDLSYTELPYFDATRQATVLRGLAPLTKLRGLNLYGTNATDADMEWLAACTRLEAIDLSDTRIGDHGLVQLARLPNLRLLRISSPRVSDQGCQSIARMKNLEELSLASSNIRTEAAILELARLDKLRLLDLGVSASEAALDELRRRVPQCQINSRRY